MTLWWFLLEPLEERYTESWSRWFPKTFDHYGIDWQEVKGDSLTTTIEEGEFLDIHGRPYYALSQIQNFIKLIKIGKVKNGDKLFFADLWHHGIEAIPYIRDLADKDIQIYGIFHAGSYDPYDFLSLKQTTVWAQWFENSIFNFVDKIFVGSEWSKELLSHTEAQPKNVVVTGLPIDCQEILDIISYVKRDNSQKIVVFPHRIAPEKGISKMMNIMAKVFELDEEVELLISSGKIDVRCRDPEIDKKFQKFIDNPKIITVSGIRKPLYYRTLAKCKVVLSTALQETFGYGTLEAVLCGCTPVVPNRLSYPDILQNDTRFFYDTNEEAVEKILKYCENPINVSDYAKRYDLPNTVGRMLKEMELV